MKSSQRSPDVAEPTPFQKIEALAKRIVAVPKKDVDALQKEWKNTKQGLYSFNFVARCRINAPTELRTSRACLSS